MSARRFEDIEFGEDLPTTDVDTALANVRLFTRAANMDFGRFTDHEEARKEGLPGAILPGIMSQGILAALIHRWAPGSNIESIDTTFRAPVLVDQPARVRGVVTHKHEDNRVEIDLTIVNAAGETRVVGTAVVRL